MDKIPTLGIIIVIALLVVGAILAYQYWWVPKQETLEEKTEEPLQKIAVLSPNGAEKWEHNKTYEIKWEKGENPEDAVTIFLANDKIWSNPLVIQSNASNTGSYSWTVPQLLTDSSGAAVTIDNNTDYKILVQGKDSGDSDLSDAPFTIASVIIISPNGGESYKAGDTVVIKWNGDNFLTELNNNLRIYWFSKPTDGKPDQSGWIASNQSLTGSFNWVIPNLVSDPNYFIGIQGPTSTLDHSDATFGIGQAASPSCSMKWWFDSNTKVCGYSQFCGAYMYYGLQTFDAESDCLTHLPYTPACSMKWWFDSSNTTCGYKQFCGAYMYYGLQTFDTQADCQAHSPSGY